MKSLILAATIVVLGACAPADHPLSPPSQSSLARGFDALGYNRTARIFNGAADGIDKVLDGKIYGDPTYASDHLVMKWNAEWDRGNRENWSNPPYDAWLDNQWSGMSNGSGSVWHYKFKWVGPCVDYTYFADGGYCIWGQFEVLQDHGVDPSFDSGHIWFARAVPGGYGG